MKKVVILGGGGGGAILANLLPKDEFDVTVIDKKENHVFLPGNLFIAFMGHKKERYMKPLKELLKPHIKFLHDEIISLDLNERKIKTKGKEIEYDYVAIATGAHLDYDAISGNTELLNKFGDYYSGPENAAKLHNTLMGMKEGNFVIAVADPIYMCPPAPQKGAFLSSKFFAKRGLKEKVKVILALPFPHAYSSKVISDIIEPELRKEGIEVHTFFTVDSIDTKNKKIFSVEGEEINYEVAVVIPIHEGPEYEVKPAEVKDDSNYIKIDKYTSKVEGFDDAYAIGDCTNAPTSKSGVTAHLQAETVASRLQGFDAKYSGRTNCPLLTNGTGLFIISDYDHPPVPVKLSKFKRLMEDLFVATYWDAIRYPELWEPIFKAYFEATNPEVLGKEGW